jgi:hypothetical protein
MLPMNGLIITQLAKKFRAFMEHEHPLPYSEMADIE